MEKGQPLSEGLTMKKSKKIILFFSSILTMLPLYTAAFITPYIIETRTLLFGEVIFIPGSCTMAHDTMVITNITAQNICVDGIGSSGSYRIFANPNKQVQIKINSHINSGNGIVYVPSGILESDVESKNIIPDINETIDSGASGIINITLGGRLTINTILTPSSTNSELFNIDFTEL